MINDFKLRYEFVKRLENLIQEDVELLDALELISEIDRKKVKKVITKLKKGYSIRESFSAISNDYEFLSFFESAEKTGSIKNALIVLKNKYEFKMNFKKRLISLSIYPIIVLFTSNIIVYILLLLVVPRFKYIYKDNNIDIPKVTKFIIYLSDNLVKISIFLLFLICLSVGGLMYLFKRYKIYLDKLLLKIKILKLIQIAKFSKNISILLNSNVTLVEAMEISKPTNEHFRRKVNIIISGIKKGESIYLSFKKTNIFDEIFLCYIKIADNTGNVKKAFNNISSIYEENIKDKLDRYLKLFEPISILIIAVIIGMITSAVMLPLLSISEYIN